MRVTVEQIKAKIPGLPANVRDFVTIDPDDHSLATVKSFSGKGVYTVHIGIHEDDPGDKSILNSACPCDARTLCHHVTAFYAVSYNLLPIEGFLPKTTAEKPSDGQKPTDRPDLEQVLMDFVTASSRLAEVIQQMIRRHDED